eukprot:jgi/Orpsp1_1/1184314/evm.model.c7180000089047.1
MKNYFVLFTIVIIFNYFISVHSKNSNFIITIQRKKSDKNYDDETPKEQVKIDEFVNDKMNDVFDIIIENKDTYGDDKKLEELNSLPKRKRDNNQRNVVLVFKNRTRPNRNLQKRSLELTNSGNSTVEYIPYESDLIKHVCPVLNTYAISAYLSDEAAEIVCKMDNIIDCVKSTNYKPTYTIHNKNENENENEDDIGVEIEVETETENLIENENITENIINNKIENIYYDIEAIKKETNWSDVSVQQISYDCNYLSLISQSPFIGKNTKDENFYYPSSAGQGIDIYFLDEGLIVNHEDFDTYEGTPDERTITCDVIATKSGLDYTDEEGKKNCQTYKTTIPEHGIMVSSLAGGKIYGVSKKANLHMIAIDYSSESILNGLDYVSQYGIPYKTIINMSLGGVEFNKVEYNKLKELIQKNVILIASSGNEFDNCCGDKYTDNFHSMPGYRLAINVGATESYIEKNGGITKAVFSNYGDCVDIHAPGYVVYPDVSEGSTTAYSYMHGTSCAAPLVAGVAASIMSEHPEIQYDNELMRKTLIEMSIKDAIVDMENSGSSDTPNRFLNNGKQSIYSPDEDFIKCGILSGNITVSCPDNGCCSSEGKCVSPQDDSNHQCFIENGCQNEYEYCSSLNKSIEECQIDISSDMESTELTNKCYIFQSEKCDEYYKHHLSNQFIFSNTTNVNNTSSDFIDTFDENKYYQYNDICSNHIEHLPLKCMDELEKYKKCFVEDNDRFLKTYLEYLLNEYYAYSFDEFYCFNAYKCENELKEYKECQIDITRDMEENEILKRCNIMDSEKCIKLSNLQYNEESSCYREPGEFELDYGYNSDSNHYTEMLKICNDLRGNYRSECSSNLDIYRKCIIDDLEEIFNDNPNSPHLSKECINFKSDECTKFFENPYKIINDIPSCSILSDSESNDYNYVFDNILFANFSTIQEYNKSLNDICKNTAVGENYKVRLCKNELKEHEECQFDISIDMNENEIMNRCKNFINCRSFYIDLIYDSSKCSPVKDQFEFTKNFNEEKFYQYNNICNSIADQQEIECKNSFSKYEICFKNDLNELSSAPYSNKFIQGCVDFKSECSYIYDNIDKLINENPSCSFVNEIKYDDNIYYLMFKKDIHNIQEMQIKYANLCEKVNFSENYKKEVCESELRFRKLCQIDISFDMDDEEIINKCLTIDKNMCKEFYTNLVEYKLACTEIENQSEFIKNFNQEKYDQYISICESVNEKYATECRKEFNIYNKCFELDNNKIIHEEIDPEEMKQICIDLNSKECKAFYNNRNNLLKEIPSCYVYSELYSPQYVLNYLVYREYSDSIQYYDSYMKM